MASVSLFVLSKGQPAATPPLPHPNGYDDFLAAGNVLVSKVADDSILNKDELQEFVATNSELLGCQPGQAIIHRTLHFLPHVGRQDSG